MYPSFLDVVWLTICGVLVFIMQAGFLCLEAGSTRSKNRINVILKNLTDLGLSVLIFWALGYGLMFGSSLHGLWGSDRFLSNFGENRDIWTGSFFLFQAMFCSTAVTILSGAAAERIQFKGYLVMAAVISGLIYPVFGHWVWHGIDTGQTHGWLELRGFVDFAGSTAVHSLGGWCSLAVVLVMGPRIGRFSAKRSFDESASNDMPLAFIGTLLLWFGWFGFNGGSNLVFNAQVSNIIANTLVGGSAGLIFPLIMMGLRGRAIEVRPVMNGAIAGLVSITAGCNAYSSITSVVVGAVGAGLMMATVELLEKYRIDDVVDAIPVHLAGGIWGTLAVGLFGNLSRLDTGLSRIDQIQAQVEGIVACGLWTFCLTLAVAIALRQFGLLRVSAREEHIGLNISEHGAKSSVDDIFQVMRHHARTGNFSRRVKGDSFTDVGRVGQWYNQVIMALESAVATNDTIIQTALDGILTVSCDGLTITGINPATERMFKRPEKSILGQPLQRLLGPSALISFEQLKQISQSAQSQTFLAQRLDGHAFPIELTATEGIANRTRFFTIFMRDISARQAAEDNLRASRAQEKAKAIALENALTQLKRAQVQLIQRERLAGQGQLVAGIAHEINNPANFIHGNLTHAESYVADLLSMLTKYQQASSQLPDTIRAELKQDCEALEIDYIAEDYGPLFTSMKNGTDRIRTIVTELRNFSRLDESDIKAVDLNSCLNSTLTVLHHRLQGTARRPEISIEKEYGSLPPVECYASALNRVFFNLLSNAVDAFDRQGNQLVTQASAHGSTHKGHRFINPSPCITLSTQVIKDSVQIVIANNGPTISESDLRKIFDPFFTTQPVGKGTGLGCTMAYQIVVEQHKGNLICRSSKKRGTAFVITLPTAPPNPATNQTALTSTIRRTLKQASLS